MTRVGLLVAIAARSCTLDAKMLLKWKKVGKRGAENHVISVFTEEGLGGSWRQSHFRLRPRRGKA